MGISSKRPDEDKRVEIRIDALRKKKYGNLKLVSLYTHDFRNNHEILVTRILKKVIDSRSDLHKREEFISESLTSLRPYGLVMTKAELGTLYDTLALYI